MIGDRQWWWQLPEQVPVEVVDDIVQSNENYGTIFTGE